MIRSLGLLLPFLLVLPASALDLILPTANRALLTGDGPAYYQYTDRSFEGRKSSPWQGGQYGFTRTPVRTSGGVVYKQFHEGLDIKPLGRDAAGDPTDPILAIAEGRVVHTSQVPGYSNYGRYVVIEHSWDGSPVYSLYAHLASIGVKPGDRVRQGEKIGLMGYTGRGIDRTRAHVHFEICLLLNDRFQAWHERVFPTEPNRHGHFNGLNLAGIDPAGLYLALAKNPALTFPQYLEKQSAVFRVTVSKQPLDFLRRYPWLQQGGSEGSSWEITFSGSGVPLRVEASSRSVERPTVTWTTKSNYPLQYISRGYVTGSGASARLSESGERFLALILL